MEGQPRRDTSSFQCQCFQVEGPVTGIERSDLGARFSGLHWRSVPASPLKRSKIESTEFWPRDGACDVDAQVSAVVMPHVDKL